MAVLSSKNYGVCWTDDKTPLPTSYVQNEYVTKNVFHCRLIKFSFILFLLLLYFVLLKSMNENCCNVIINFWYSFKWIIQSIFLFHWTWRQCTTRDVFSISVSFSSNKFSHLLRWEREGLYCHPFDGIFHHGWATFVVKNVC